MGGIPDYIDLLAAFAVQVRANGRIRRISQSVKDTGRHKQLDTVANTCDQLVLAGKMSNDRGHTEVESDVFRGPPSGQVQSIVGGWIDFIEGGDQHEVMAQHRQCLKRYHHLAILYVVPYQHQYLLRGHREIPTY